MLLESLFLRDGYFAFSNVTKSDVASFTDSISAGSVAASTYWLFVP